MRLGLRLLVRSNMNAEKTVKEIATGRNQGLLDHASRLGATDKESARMARNPIAVITAAITATRVLIFFGIDTISVKAWRWS